jgi:hypothetical protein
MTRTVAVLGTGIMGVAMARNLAGAGMAVRAWNRTREKAEPLAEDGVTVADTPARAAEGADFLNFMLSDADAVAAAMSGGAISALADGGQDPTLIWSATGIPIPFEKNRIHRVSEIPSLACRKTPGADDGRPEIHGEVTARGGKRSDSMHSGNPAVASPFPVGVLARGNGDERHGPFLPRRGLASGGAAGVGNRLGPGISAGQGRTPKGGSMTAPSLKSSGPRDVLVRAWASNRPLAFVGATMLLVLVVSLAGLLLDPRVITGAPAWLKPMKFAISISIYCFTLLWMLTFVRGHRRLVGLISWVTAVALLVEMVLIAGAAALGTTSHFNVSTPLHAAVWYTMAGPGRDFAGPRRQPCPPAARTC